MAVQGQPLVSYSWDDANRLTQVTQAAGTINGGTAQTITFQYDAANRRTQTVLPNGVTVSYTYDNADELTEIDYVRSDTTVIGNITYTYDAAGHRTSIGGTLANVIIPTLSASATYDADNRLTQLNGVTQTYDANGSLTGDGANVYSWDARNQLTDVSGPTNASFAYDGVGRRTQRTIGGVTKQYVYDGLDYVQEQDGGGALTAAVLKGGIDEALARMTPTAISSPLTDALGSVVAETDSSQSLTTTYSYDPYGSTSVTGTSTGNPLNYVGRENDLPELYFYRARFYNPAIARFISQDPIRFLGGINFYAYVANNPVSNVDPLGLLTGFASGGWIFVPFYGGNETNGGYYFSPDSNGLFTSTGDNNYGAYAGAGLTLGFIKGCTKDFQCPFTNWNLATPWVGLSLYFANGQWMGLGVSFGPAIGYATTNTTTVTGP
jgi:RHS repeat-associated protein